MVYNYSNSRDTGEFRRFFKTPCMFIFSASDCGVIDFACQQRTEKGLGLTYKGGTVNTTITGKNCQSWSANSPQSNNFLHLNWEHNYCRNPDNESRGVWCYTMEEEARWEFCDVRECKNCDKRED